MNKYKSDEVAHIDFAKQKIYYDHRENADHLITELQNSGFELIRKSLNIGDYIICPDTTIERKTTQDFCLSILDGRLFSQAYRLSVFCENPIFIVEGESFKENHSLSISLEAIRGALISLAQTYRIPVLRTLNTEDTAWHMNQLSMQRKRIGEHKGPLTAYAPKKIQTRKEYILRAFPGVGTKMAKKLLDEFGNITNVINASEKDLAKIHGLGPKIIADFKNVLKEEHAIYKSERSDW